MESAARRYSQLQASWLSSCLAQAETAHTLSTANRYDLGRRGAKLERTDLITSKR